MEPVSADIRTRLCSRARISPGNGLTRPETGRHFWRRRPILGGRDRRVSGGKAAESQRLFRSRQEGDVSQDCVVGAQEAACTHRINDINAQTSSKSHIGAKRQLSGVTNFAATNATEELGAIAPSTLQTDVLRAIPAKAGTNAVAGAGPTAPSPPRTDTLRAMLVKATKRRRRPA